MAQVSKRCRWHFERSEHKQALPFARKRGRPTTINNFFQQVVVQGASVLHKCANPDCSAKLVYLRQGRLFEVEVQVTGSSKREYYWLCGQCATGYTLCFDCERSMLAVTSLRETNDSKLTAIHQSSKAIFGLKRVLIRSFGPPWTKGKEAATPTLSGMEES